jgi:TolB-like protein
MKRQDSKTRIVVFCFLAHLLGCASGDVYFEPTMDFGSLQAVAVLPFQDLTGSKDAAERVRDTFMGRLLATEAVYVLPPGEVARGINRIGGLPQKGPSTEQIQKLANVLSVQGIITGVVREYGTVRSGAAAANVVSVSLQLIETSGGIVVWSASSTKGGISVWDRLVGGGGEPMNSVTEKVVNELLDKLFE